MKFKDTIACINEAFSNEECDEILEVFKFAKTNNLAQPGYSASGLDATFKVSTDFNLLKSPHKEHIDLANRIMTKFNSLVTDSYLHKFPYQEEYEPGYLEFHAPSFYEVAQIQEYEKDKGHYNAWHSEVCNFHTSRRMFSFLLYLNSVGEGGETEFLYAEDDKGDMLRFKPTKGSLLIHPASFPYVHRGLVPLSSNKIILTGWLSFTPDQK